MRILVTGAAGQVGTELVLSGSKKGHEILGFTRKDLDITNEDVVLRTISDLTPDVVINPAAYTAVDQAETDRELAYIINRDGPANLAKACSKNNIPLIHISTDYVYDGSKSGAYTENDPVQPVNVYGASKEAGEAAIREILDQHIIMRTSWVFSSHGGNFVKSMLRLGHNRDELNIVADQRGGPTSASDIAGASIRIAEHVHSQSDLWGTYHFSGAPETSWYEFAQEIFNQASGLVAKAPTVRPIPTTDYPTPARRPLNSVMNCEKIFKAFGIQQPAWKNSLNKVLQELENGIKK